MNMELVKKVTEDQLKTNIPEFKAGDTVKVHVRIVEGNKSGFKSSKAPLSLVGVRDFRIVYRA